MGKKAFNLILFIYTLLEEIEKMSSDATKITKRRRKANSKTHLVGSFEAQQVFGPNTQAKNGINKHSIRFF